MDVRELRSTLRKLEASEDRSGHHVYFYVEIEGRDHGVSKLSHSMRGELPPFVTKDTAKRLRLTSNEFSALVECQLDKTHFLHLWKLRGS